MVLLLGTYSYANGNKYEGQWKQKKKDGKGKTLTSALGVLTFSNGDKYDGQWSDDQMSGNGKTKAESNRSDGVC